MFDIDIAQLSRRTGLPASTLRYYEEKGLIASVGRRGAKRLFDLSVVERLSLIALGRASGFSLDEIAPMLAGPAVDKARLRAKAGEIGDRIAQLERMRQGLLHAADCPAPSLMECPSFRRLMQAASDPARKPGRRALRAEPA